MAILCGTIAQLMYIETPLAGSPPGKQQACTIARFLPQIKACPSVRRTGSFLTAWLPAVIYPEISSLLHRNFPQRCKSALVALGLSFWTQRDPSWSIGALDYSPNSWRNGLLWSLL